MKKYILIIIFALFATISCFAQIPKQDITDTTEQEYYSKLASLFAVDVQMLGDTRENYDNYQSTRLREPFSNSRVLTLNGDPNVNTSINKILVVVNSSIYNQLSNKIERYAYDINYLYGCEVIMEIVTGGDHTNIKNLIITNQTNLDGVVFIGDIAAAWFEIVNDYYGYITNPNGEGYAVWPCDLYYMDINGTWSDTDGNDIYDTHTGSVQPEIFVGRISTANMGTLLSEKELLERYLDKDHKFWMGNTTVNKKFGLSYTDKDWASFNYFKTDIQYLYGNTNFDQVKYGDAEFGKTDYLNRLTNDRYEFIQLACHTSSPLQLSMTGGEIFSNEIFNNGTQAIGYNLFCCSGCNWTAFSLKPNRIFLGGAHIYNAGSSSLVVVGSTKTGSMLQFNYFYTPLGQGKTIGEAFKQWWIYGAVYASNFIVSWHYGMTIIGDPLVNFFHCMCVHKITLNGFDTSNTDPIQHIIAKDKITANNYVIPPGKHVIFNAKEVELNSGFECQLGGSFEIINEGCCP